jgi:hypothetical protein
LTAQKIPNEPTAPPSREFLDGPRIGSLTIGSTNAIPFTAGI